MNTKVWLHYIPQSWASEVFSSIKEKKAKHTEEHLKDNWLNVPAVLHIRAMKRKLEVTFFFSVHMAWVLAPRVMAKTIVAENNVVARVQHKSKKKKIKFDLHALITPYCHTGFYLARPLSSENNEKKISQYQKARASDSHWKEKQPCVAQRDKFSGFCLAQYGGVGLISLMKSSPAFCCWQHPEVSCLPVLG